MLAYRGAGRRATTVVFYGAVDVCAPVQIGTIDRHTRGDNLMLRMVGQIAVIASRPRRLTLHEVVKATVDLSYVCYDGMLRARQFVQRSKFAAFLTCNHQQPFLFLHELDARRQPIGCAWWRCHLVPSASHVHVTRHQVALASVVQSRSSPTSYLIHSRR